MPFFLLLFIFFPFSLSAESNHLVVAEIQTYGTAASDEFIKLYNPTENILDISGWKLTKKTSSGSESNLVSKFSDGAKINPHSYFLIVPQNGYHGQLAPDTTYTGASYSLANNNAVILKNAEGAMIDKVGFGEAQDFEGAPAPNPAVGGSILRKDNLDTDNNKNDFIIFSPAAVNPSPASALPQTNNLPPPVKPSAQYGDVLINEIMPDPADGKEWIEIYNPTEKNILLDGWKISDGASVIYELSGPFFADSFLTIEINNRLNNSGDAVYLADAQNNSIYQLTYGDWLNAQWPAPKKGESLSRGEEEKFYSTKTPTKNAPNKITQDLKENQNLLPRQTSPSSTSPIDTKYISIIEILPNPEGIDTENEYLKLYNAAEDDLDLGGLYLDDEEGGSAPYPLPQQTMIKAKNFLIFYRAKTKLAFNNGSDAARLLDFNKTEISRVEYEDAPEGAIYRLVNNQWGFTGENNSGRQNDNNENNDNDKKIKTTKIKQMTGVIVAEPGVFGSRIAYLDGMQLYLHSTEWPQIKVGDKIAVWGEMTGYFGEPRLKLKNKNSLKIISSGEESIPDKISGEEISDEYLGRLVMIEGEILERQSKKIFIDAGGAELAVYNKTKENIFENLEEKDLLQFIGILSRYKDSFRLLPRRAEDMQILQKSPENSALPKNMSFRYYIGGTLIMASLAFGLHLRRGRNGTKIAKITGKLE